ncbi:Yip1 family protein [Granulosicoccaceae sp. 1_MG-2023]|nr:Yip1 family protein [Granulosicoccaceae sp. 1_MG-2023]
MILNHVTGILFHPAQEWKSIREENASTMEVFRRHVLIMAAIPPLCAFFGATQFGWQLGETTFKLTKASAGQMAIGFYLASLLGVYFMGRCIQWMADTYGAGSSDDKAENLAAYIITPMFLAGLVCLIPVPWLIMMVGLLGVAYTVYLLYTGVPIMMGVSAEKGFLFSSAVLTVGMVTMVGVLATTVILWGIGLGPQHA